MVNKYIDIRITAISDDDLLDFIALCMAIQYAGDKGSNETFTVVVDGDGSGRLSFKDISRNKDIPSMLPENNKIYIGE